MVVTHSALHWELIQVSVEVLFWGMLGLGRHARIACCLLLL